MASRSGRVSARLALFITACAVLPAVLLSARSLAATLDASGGVLTYTAAVGAVNSLTVSLSSGNYTIDDPGEAAISLGAGALAAGCANLDANTVTCPKSAVTAWNVQLGDQNDSATLTAVLEPTTIRGGPGNDLLVGGAAADTFAWSPGDASDTVQGGPGSDVLDFSGSNINENYTISAFSGGFQLTRDVASVVLQAIDVEALVLHTLGGDDTVTTQPLPTTSQSLDGGAQSAIDTINYDAGGLCTTQGSGSFQSLGSQIVTYTGFETANLLNQCTVFPAALDIAGGALTYTAGTGAANAVSVSLSAGSYTIDDTGVPAITLAAGALAAGCANLDANTVTCPESAIAAWNLDLGDQNDSATLSAVLEPITIRGGPGNDFLVGGAAADTFTWFPGDASDTLEGGPGSDTLSFSGSNINENYSISAISGGFQLTRDVATVVLQALDIEALVLQTLGGDDTVTTHPLPTTSQSLDGGLQSAADTINYDAGGLCTTQGVGSFQSLGSQIVTYTGFETVSLLNQCTVFPAALDLSGGALTYTAGTGAANAVSVSLSAGSYTIDDTGVPAITLGAGALASGCVSLDANTAKCPESAITSWNLQLGDQNDSATLSAVLEPTTIHGGPGNDLLIGGAGADTFTWSPGDASDTLDGGPGSDTLSFNGSNINENYTISAISGGFQLTRDVASVVLQAIGVEALSLHTLGGDDTVTTHPLLTTSQSLDGGAQSVVDTLSYDAGGACTTQGAGSFQSTSAQIVTYAGFETVSLLGQCVPVPVPAIEGMPRVLLAALLGMAVIWLGARRLAAQPGRSSS